MKKKRVLVISYYWPPAGGISVHRCLKLVKYLHLFGWEPVVATVENPTYFFFDESNFKDIPENLEIIKTKIWEPHRLFGLLTGIKNKDRFPDVFVEEKKSNFASKIGIWIRGNIFIPDARMFWINKAVKQIEKYLKEHPVDAVFSNGPPHSAHMIAYKLKKKLRIPWLADFQDPWTQADYFQKLMLNPLSRSIHKAKEQLIFKNADKITICSNSWKSGLELIGADNVSTVYWGYDEDDFLIENNDPTEKFKIYHFGRLSPDRNPGTLWKALSDLTRENTQFKNDLEIELIGYNSHSVIEDINKNGLEKNLILTGHIEHDKALAKMKHSSMLLLVLNDAENVNGRIPGKLFEYLASKRTLLVVSPEESDAAKIVVHLKSGYVCGFNDHNRTRETILNFYNRFKEEGLIEISADIEPYSNKNTTSKFADLLNQIINNDR